jgi:hypothetical protein
MQPGNPPQVKSSKAQIQAKFHKVLAILTGNQVRFSASVPSERFLEFGVGHNHMVSSPLLIFFG